MELKKVEKQLNPKHKKHFLPKDTWKKDCSKNKSLYMIFIPVAAYFFIFHYLPMFGIVMAFQDFRASRGFLNSEWVGIANFIRLFSGENFLRIMRNTIVMAGLNLTLGFVAPIMLALILAQVRVKPFKRMTQIISYMPYFVTAIVVSALLKDFLREDGIITMLFVNLGNSNENMLANPKNFWMINTLTEIWQGVGYGAIVYVAAIANINSTLMEASSIDGANRFQRMIHITIPSIIPLVIVMFTLRIGLVFVTGFDKVLLLYMPKTYETADVLTTYVFRMGIGLGDYGLAAAAGLFQSIIATMLLLLSNRLNHMATKKSLV